MKKDVKLSKGSSRRWGRCTYVNKYPVPWLHALAIAGCSLGPVAWSQETGTAVLQLEEVIVTAEKVEKSLQDTPISVMAFSGQDLADRSISDMRDLQNFLPNVSIGGFAGGDADSQWFIRGVGQNSGGGGRGVGLYIDEVFYPSAYGSLLSVLDIERVEVLRGPQGTLFGRNTTGGLIHFVSKKPVNEFEGSIEATFGSFDRQDFQALVNVPMGDTLSARFTLASLERDGFVKVENRSGTAYGDVDSEVFRAQLRYQPSDSLSVDFSTSLTRWQDSGSAQAPTTIDRELAFMYAGFAAVNPAAAPIESFSRSCDTGDSAKCTVAGSDLNQSREGEAVFTSLTFTADVTDNIAFKSITAYLDVESEQHAQDFDGTPLPIFSQGTAPGHDDTGPFFDDSRQFSQEFQLRGLAFDERVDWTAGLYFADETENSGKLGAGGTNFWLSIPLPPPVNIIGFPFGIAGEKYRTETQNKGAFVNADIAITEQIGLTLGVRKNEDDVDYEIFGEPLSGSDDFGKTVGRAVIEYAWTEDIMTYVSWSEGYKRGGIDSSCSTCIDSFDEENIESLEVGLRSEWLDSRLRLNATYFDMDYTDMQISALTDELTTITSNVGKVKLDGVEIELTAVATEHLTFNLAVGTLDHDIKSITGTAGSTEEIGLDSLLPRAPELSYTVGFRYGHILANAGELSFQLDHSYTDEQKSWLDDFNAIVMPDFRLTNLRLQYHEPDGNWSVALFCSNCSDEKYLTGGIKATHAWGTNLSNFGRPREVGVNLRMNF